MEAVSLAPSELAAQVRGAVTRLARQIRYEARGAVATTQLSALGTIARRGPLTLGELAEHDRVSPPMVTRVVSELEHAGLVVRTVDPNDRRVSRGRGDCLR